LRAVKNDPEPERPAFYPGACHCGRVRFRVRVRRLEALECNCSICSRKGFVHLIVPLDDFELLSEESALALYTFNTGKARHRFCKTCGVHPFYTPRSHPDQIDVNVRCLEGVSLDAFSVTAFDGKNWEASIQNLRRA
jgi:hypothetical protein